MIDNSTHITKSCKCNNPQIIIVLSKEIKSGKNFGKERVLCYCKNCKAQWWKIKNK